MGSIRAEVNGARANGFNQRPFDKPSLQSRNRILCLRHSDHNQGFLATRKLRNDIIAICRNPPQQPPNLLTPKQTHWEHFYYGNCPLERPYCQPKLLCSFRSVIQVELHSKLLSCNVLNYILNCIRTYSFFIEKSSDLPKNRR